MKHQLLTLPNEGKWIPYNQIIYYEEGFSKKINQNILAQYPTLRDEALKNNVLFFYLPGLSGELKTASELFSKTLRYNYPEWSDIQINEWVNDLQNFIHNISNYKFYDTIGNSAFSHNAPDPVHLIRRLDEERIVVWNYTSFINEKREISIPEECFYNSFRFNSEFIDNDKNNNIDYEIADFPDHSNVYDVDDSFVCDGDKLSREIIDRMAILSKEGLYGSLIETLLFAVSDIWVETTGKSGPYNMTPEQLDIYIKTCEKLAINYLDLKTNVFIFDSKPVLSSLIIDEEFRIWLPGFNNMEVILKPLPKALFILFLKHPEGILLKHLTDYKIELNLIYNIISNRTEQTEIDKSINAMVDPTNNSVNEKCSRIKEAFLTVMDDSVAKNYYITGERGMPKIISINSSKVSLLF